MIQNLTGGRGKAVDRLGQPDDELPLAAGPDQDGRTVADFFGGQRRPYGFAGVLGKGDD
jgi:hypothetical protein